MKKLNPQMQLLFDQFKNLGLNPRPTARGGFRALCPSHDDSNPSLEADVGERQPVLIQCRSNGCSVEEILAAVGLTVADICAVVTKKKRTRRKRKTSNGATLPTTARSTTAAATYDYVSKYGELLYQVIRGGKKTFRQRRPGSNGAWIWNLRGVTRQLYNLPRVLDAVRARRPVIIVEGEKDADRITALGKVATTKSGGASAAWEPQYTEALRGAVVTVIQDRDDAGRKSAREIVAALRGIASEVELVEAATGNDVSDHLDAGFALDDLDVVEDPEDPEDVAVDDDDDDEGETAARADASVRASVLDLTKIQNPDVARVEWYVADIIAESSNILVAAGWKTGKTLVLYSGLIEASYGRPMWGKFMARPDLRIQVWQFEMPERVNLTRLRKLIRGLGLDPRTFGTDGRFQLIVQPDLDLSDPADVATFHRAVDEFDPHILLIDSAGEAGFSVSDNREVRRELKAVLNPLTSAGRSTIVITHKRKTMAGARNQTNGGRTDERDSIIGAQSWGAKASQVFTMERVREGDNLGEFWIRLNSLDGWDLVDATDVHLDVREVDVKGETATRITLVDPKDIPGTAAEPKRDEAKRLLIERVKKKLQTRQNLIDALVDEDGIAKATAGRAYRDLIKENVIMVRGGTLRIASP